MCTQDHEALARAHQAATAGPSRPAGLDMDDMSDGDDGDSDDLPQVRDTCVCSRHHALYTNTHTHACALANSAMGENSKHTSCSMCEYLSLCLCVSLCVCVTQVPLDELLDDLEALGIHEEGEGGHTHTHTDLSQLPLPDDLDEDMEDA